MATDDFYELLGVPRDAGDDEIKRAYRKLARELHPDTNPDPAAEERFKQITLAYEVLRDPERRERYDRFGIDGLRGGGAGDPFDFGGGLSDLFEAFFGGDPFGGGRRSRGGRPAPMRGADLEAVLHLDFDTAVFGAQEELEVRAPAACETCSGSGAQPGTSPTECSQCGGTGELRRVRQSLLGQMVTAAPCGRCGGLGQEILNPCPDCRGEGRRTEAKTYRVDVPAGVDDGTTLRLTGRGAAGPRGGPPGDLYVHLHVRPHERFERFGADLLHELHIPVTQAALGAHLELETLDGVEEVVVAPGTQSGTEIRFRGRGVPYLDGRGRGELVVRVIVDTPANLTREQAALLRELAEQRGEAVDPEDAGFLSRLRSAFK